MHWNNENSLLWEIFIIWNVPCFKSLHVFGNMEKWWKIVTLWIDLFHQKKHTSYRRFLLLRNQFFLLHLVNTKKNERRPCVTRLLQSKKSWPSRTNIILPFIDIYLLRGGVMLCILNFKTLWFERNIWYWLY